MNEANADNDPICFDSLCLLSFRSIDRLINQSIDHSSPNNSSF